MGCESSLECCIEPSPPRNSSEETSTVRGRLDLVDLKFIGELRSKSILGRYLDSPSSLCTSLQDPQLLQLLDKGENYLSSKKKAKRQYTRKVMITQFQLSESSLLSDHPQVPHLPDNKLESGRTMGSSKVSEPLSQKKIRKLTNKKSGVSIRCSEQSGESATNSAGDDRFARFLMEMDRQKFMNSNVKYQ